MLRRLAQIHLLCSATFALAAVTSGCSSELPQQAAGKEASAEEQKTPPKKPVDEERKRMLEEALSKSQRPASSGTSGSQSGGAAPAPAPGPVSGVPVWRSLGLYPWTEDQRATYEGFAQCTGTPASLDKSSCADPKTACRFELQSPCTEKDNPGLANCVRLFYCE